MAVILTTGEVIFCDEVDEFEDYIMADMTFYPVTHVYEIMEV